MTRAHLEHVPPVQLLQSIRTVLNIAYRQRAGDRVNGGNSMGNSAAGMMPQDLQLGSDALHARLHGHATSGCTAAEQLKRENHAQLQTLFA
jgi:hypothetical protein